MPYDPARLLRQIDLTLVQLEPALADRLVGSLVATMEGPCHNPDRVGVIPTVDSLRESQSMQHAMSSQRRSSASDQLEGGELDQVQGGLALDRPQTAVRSVKDVLEYQQGGENT